MGRIGPRLVVLALVLGAALALPQAVAAHALLQSSVPAAGSTLAASPSAVTITFGEQPDARLSSIKVLDSSGRNVASGPSTAVPGAPLQLTVPLPSLPDGVYTVSWRTVSAVDGHVAAGSFAFGVGVGPPRRRQRRIVGRVGASADPARRLDRPVDPLRGPHRPPRSRRHRPRRVPGAAAERPAARRRGLGDGAGRHDRRHRRPVVGRRLRPLDDPRQLDRSRRRRAHRRDRRSPAWRSWRPRELPPRRAPEPPSPSSQPGRPRPCSSTSSTATRPAARCAILEIAAEWAHVLAVGVWIGGLAALLLGVRGAASEEKGRAVRRFSTAAGHLDRRRRRDRLHPGARRGRLDRRAVQHRLRPSHRHQDCPVRRPRRARCVQPLLQRPARIPGPYPAAPGRAGSR